MQTKCGICEKDCVCRSCQKSIECKYATREDCKRCVECGKYEPCYPFNRILSDDRLITELLKEQALSEVRRND